MKKLQATLKRKKSMKFNTDAVDYRMLVMGLESTGKSSIINMIVSKEATKNTEPTHGVSVVAHSTNGKSIIFHEIGGNIHSRGLMSYYYSCDAVIYVIDSTQNNNFAKNHINNIPPSPVIKSIISPLPPSKTHDVDHTECSYYDDFDIDTKSNDDEMNKPKLRKSSSTKYKLSNLMSKFEKFDKKVGNKLNRNRISNIDRPKLRQSKSVNIPKHDNIDNIPELPQHHRSIDSYIMDTDHTRNYSFTKQLKAGSDTLQPLTMNEAKCESAQELISKLNYELKSVDIPFLIYYNKQDDDEAMNQYDITKRMAFDTIINKTRIYGIFNCNAFNKEQVYNGWHWLLKTLKDIKNKKKQNAKVMSQLNETDGALETIDLCKYGPNAINPRCVICDKPCKLMGAYCTVCGKWYCQRDVMTKMLHRKSGNAKCRECVGQKSKFFEQGK